MCWKLEEAITYYRRLGAPADQAALVSLLSEIQTENNGGIPLSVIPVISQAYAVKEAFLLALIKRIPRLRLNNTHTLEMCAGPNCGKHTALTALGEKLAKERNFTLKYCGCMRMCGKGPNIKWDGKIYHNADEALLRRLTDEIK